MKRAPTIETLTERLAAARKSASYWHRSSRQKQAVIDELMRSAPAKARDEAERLLDVPIRRGGGTRKGTRGKTRPRKRIGRKAPL